MGKKETGDCTVSGARSSTVLIRTHEGITFSLLVAGPMARFLAWVLDFFCIMIIVNVTSILLTVFHLISSDLAQALVVLLYFSVSIGYGITMEWYSHGQTLGKRILRLRVMDQRGFRLQASQIIVRNLLRFVDSLPFFYLVGGVVSLLSPHGQRLGDLAANTIVVRNPEIAEPDLDQLMPGKFNSLREYPHLGARLRQASSPEGSAIALQALMRRRELDPKARVELFREIADHFRSLVRFPQEAAEGISDEQYVRNVVDILFRS